jgi:hypothetical protein
MVSFHVCMYRNTAAVKYLIPCPLCSDPQKKILETVLCRVCGDIGKITFGRYSWWVDQREGRIA